MAIQIQHLSKAFDSKPVLADFSAEIPEKAVTCLMGESGCGKTTLLYLLAGLISPDAGEISGISGKIAFVFQENRLAENFTVYRNLKMVCKGQKISKEMLGEMLENVGMDKALLRAPVSSLSGGMNGALRSCAHFSVTVRSSFSMSRPPAWMRTTKKQLPPISAKRRRIKPYFG